jgi:hypothetical protein
MLRNPTLLGMAEEVYPSETNGMNPTDHKLLSPKVTYLQNRRYSCITLFLSTELMVGNVTFLGQVFAPPPAVSKLIAD